MTHTRQNWMTNSDLLITVFPFEEKDLAPGVPRNEEMRLFTTAATSDTYSATAVSLNTLSVSCRLRSWLNAGQPPASSEREVRVAASVEAEVPPPAARNARR